MIPLLVRACPAFEPDDDDLIHPALGRLARRSLELLREGRTEELSALFDAIARLHLEGDAYVREAATIGFLEALQNVALHRGVALDTIEPLLGHDSRRWWRALIRFWAGEIPRVDPAL